MKTKAVPAHELKIGDIIRQPQGQTLYHLVTSHAALHCHPKHEVTVGVDNGTFLEFDFDDFVYVLVSES
jgi:hypothetical protein